MDFSNAVAQIEMAMRESDGSIEHLTSVFTSMMSDQSAISETVDGTPDIEEMSQNINYDFEWSCKEMESVAAFPFSIN
ncbi:MAG: hypothetical protein KAI17_04225 [Thiotrichaceae bacterium]|nr:hypothetical protein [Thiotrichaceae bacterium]